MGGTRSGDVTARRIRAGLLATTALTAAVLLHAAPARAQPAPSARPQGGQVVAGSASISTTPSTTTIDQSTQRAAINWNSFNVGSQQTVTFEQPSSTSMTLNRVTGADPSAIAGRIDANGGIVITNPDGVVFYRGSQVNATDLVVSAPGISNRNFMAGRMVFNQPAKPRAAVVNRGNLTIRQAGLGALVAPEVRNRGTITARLGHVALAGGDAATLDMYGDGLVSIDVTRQVTRAPNGHEALVTNTGVIEANGGTVQLTAAAADGVVSTLVDARGHIGASSVGNHPGTVAIAGTGGALLVAGTVLAGGAQGGAIEVAGPGDVTVGPHARVSASGADGGGVVAIGTDLARARGGSSVTPTVIARSVTVARGARISASARQFGNGGTVTLLSTDVTVQNGDITARSGTLSGNGGLVEISSQGGVGLTGSVDVGAAHGALGTILLDPGTLDIVAGASGQGTADGTLIASGGTLAFGVPNSTSAVTVTDGAVDSLEGNIVLQATTLLTVSAPITLTIHGQGLTLQSNVDLTTSAAIKTAGDISLGAGNTLSVGAAITTTGGSVNLSGDTSLSIGGTSVTAPVSASGTIALNGGGIGVSIFAGSPITAGGSLAIIGAEVSTGDSLVSQAGGITVDGADMLTISGPVNASGDILLTGIDINVSASVTSKSGSVNVIGDGAGVDISGGTISAGGGITISGGPGITIGDTLTAAGDISLSGGSNASITAPVTSTGGSVTIGNAALLSVSAPITAQADVDASGADVTFSASVTSKRGSVNLTAEGNLSLGSGTISAGGGITFAGGSPLSLGDTLTAGGDISIGGGEVAEINAPVTSTGGNVTIFNTPFVAVSAAITAQTGNIDISASDVLTASSPIGAGGSATLAASSILQINAPVSVGAGQEIIASAPLVVLGGTLTVPGSPGTPQAVGPVNVLVQADTLTVTRPINAPGGIVAFTPFTPGNPLTVDNSQPASSGPVLTTSELGLVNTGGGGLNASLYLGGVGAPQTPIAGNLTVNSPLTLPSGQSVGLFSSGDVAIGAAINLSGPAALTARAGGDLSTSAPITSAGGPVSISGAEVEIGASITLNGPGQPLTIQSSGDLLTFGAITTQGNIDLAANSSAAGTPSGTGTLSLSAPVGTSSGSVSLSGVGVFIGTNGEGESPAPVTVQRGTIGVTAGANGVASTPLSTLLANGKISIETPGTVTLTGPVISTGGGVTIGGSSVDIDAFLSAGTTIGINATTDLTTAGGGTMIAAGSIDLNSAGTVTISPPVISGGNVSITSGAAVTITDPVTAGTGYEILVAAPVVSIFAPLTVPGTLTPRQLGGPVNVLVQANTLTIADFISTIMAHGSIVAPGGIVAFTPYTQNFPLTVDNSGLASNGPVLTSAELARVQTIGFDGATPVTGSLYLGGVGSGMTPVAATTTLNISTDITPIASTLGLFATGLVSETGASIVTAGTLVGGANAAPLTNGNVVGNLGSFTTSTGFSLADTAPLAIIGSVTDPTSISLTDTGGPITEALGGGSLTTGLLSGSTNALARFANTNAVTTLGSFAAPDGFTLVNTVPLTAASPVTGGPLVSITDSGPVTLAGPVTATVVALTATGSALTETSSLLGTGVINAGTLTGAAGSATLGNANVIGDLGGFTSSAGFLLSDTAPLAIIGAVNDPTSITLTDTGGAITEALGGGGSLTTGLLTGATKASAQFASTNAVMTLGSFAAPGGFTLVNSGPLTVSGPVTGGPLVNITDSGAVTLNGSLTATVVGLTATGGLSENGAGVINTGTLFGAAGSATLGTANTIATLATFTTTSGFELNDNTGLIITGLVSAPSGTVSIVTNGALTESGGSISAATLTGSATSTSLGGANTVSVLGGFTTTSGFALNDTTGLVITDLVSAPSGTVSLVTNGALTETGGSIDAAMLAGSASSAQLNDANTIGTLGSVSAPGGFALADLQSLLVTGPVDPSSVAIVDTRSITLAGDVNAPTVSLIAQNGSIGQTAGVLAAGVLTGSAATSAQFGGIARGVALVGTLGSFTVGTGAFVLADSEALTVAGPLTAPFFQVSAPGQITLANATITTTGLPLAAQSGATPAVPGSNFQVTPVGGTGNLVQTGVATIQGLDGTKATVRIDIPAGNILLADLQAPTADIILGSPSGQLLGNLFADNLLVIGTLGSSNLFGSIRGVTTPGAAALGQIEPAVNVAYLFNGCVIASATCGGAPGRVGNFPPTATLLLPTLSIEDLNAVLSDTDPATLQPNGRARQNVQLHISFPPTLPGDSNPDIVLPNVSSHDY